MKRPSARATGLFALLAGAVGFGSTLLVREGGLDTPGRRAPYLQNDHGDRVTLCWTTDRPATSLVEVRGPDGASRPAGKLELTTRHEVELTGLRPGQRHAYRLQGSRQWTDFQTRPAAPRTFRFAVFGDIGDSAHAGDRAARLLRQHQPHFAVALGDLAYPTGRERLLSERFFTPLSSYSSSHVIWHVFGNHDQAAENGAPLERASEAPDNGPPGLPPDRNYSFDYGSVHVVVLDTNVDVEAIREKLAPWVEADLRASRAPWKFVMTHHPPYSSGEHGNTARVRRHLAPIFERMGVAAVFSGHDHHYERLAPERVTYVVCGTGGAHLYGLKKRRRGSQAAIQGRHGITLVDVDGHRASLQFVAAEGEVLDRFNLPAPRPPQDSTASNSQPDPERPAARHPAPREPRR